MATFDKIYGAKRPRYMDGYKQLKLVRAARAFLASQVRGALPPCRFDVVAIEGEQVQWIRDAFSA